VVPVTDSEAGCPPTDCGCSPLADLDFAVVDVETTGWSPQDAAITEVGAVRVRGGQVLGEITMLVNPGTPVPPGIFGLTGISDQLLLQAPPAGSVLPALLAFAGGCVLAAHNASFDVGFLTATCRSAGLRWPDFPVLDTVALARAVLDAGEVPDCKLGTLAAYFGVPVTPTHRALADAQATAAVLTIALNRAADRGIGTFCQLTSWLAELEETAAVGLGAILSLDPPGRHLQWSPR
jgi:DNA polymerase III subunit epsilon